MKLYQYIDEYIVDQHDRLGAEFRARDVEAWAIEQGYSFDVAGALQAHRKAPGNRVFGTERIGMGPESFYRVVDRPQGITPKAVLDMHKQQGMEMVTRWENEYRYRMNPLVARDARARAAFKRAGAQIRLVASAMHLDLAELDQELAELVETT